MYLLILRNEVAQILRLLVLIIYVKFSKGAQFHGVILHSQESSEVCLTLDYNISNDEYVSYLKLISLTRPKPIYIYERESFDNAGTTEYPTISFNSKNKQDINTVCFSKTDEYLVWTLQIQNVKTDDYTYQKKFELKLKSDHNISNCYSQTGSNSRIIFVNSDNVVRLIFNISPQITGNTIIMGQDKCSDTTTQIAKIVWQNNRISKKDFFSHGQDIVQNIAVSNEQIYVTLCSSRVKSFQRYLARHGIQHDEIFLHFVNNQPDIYVTGKAWDIEGSDLSYKCVYDKMAHQIRWYFNNAIIPNKTNSILSYRSVKIGLKGKYKCEVMKENKLYTSIDVSLKIYEIPKVYLEFESIVFEGTNIKMVCKVHFDYYSVINLTLTKDGASYMSFNKDDDSNHRSNHQSAIQFNRIQSSATGIYQCIATLTNYPEIYTSNSINLTVYYAPRCNSETDHQLIFNKSKILKCIDDAEPKVETFKWYRDIENDSNVIPGENQNELIFQKGEKENEVYICHPTNSIFNKTFCKFKLQIINKEIIQIMVNKGHMLIIVILIIIIGFVFVIWGYKQWKKTSQLSLDQIKKVQGVVSFKSDVKTNNRISFIDPARLYQQMNTTCVPFIPVKCLSVLGNGCYGEVYQGKLVRWSTLMNAKADDNYVAVKVIKDKTYENKFEEELRLHFELPAHAHVIKCLGKTKIKGKLGMILEFSPNGTLKSLLHTTFLEELPKLFSTHRNYSELLNIKCFKYAREIALGMEHIAKYKLVHRDLATRNILLDSKNACKIGDFGLSRDISENNEYFMQSNDPIPVRWLAPESLTNRIFTEKSDVWAYGIVLWEIVALGGTPYSDLKSGLSVKNAVIEGYRMPPLKHSSDEIYAIMMLCWDCDPDKRPTFRDLLEMVDHVLGESSGYINFDDYEISLYEEIDPNIYKEELIED